MISELYPVLATGPDIALAVGALAAAGSTAVAVQQATQKPPKPPELKKEAPVKETDQELQAKRDQERRDAALRQGRAKTLLARDREPMGRRTLLG